MIAVLLAAPVVVVLATTALAVAFVRWPELPLAVHTGIDPIKT